MERCDWCKGDALYEAYHDEEWGLPQHDDRRLFEFLILEGAQAGLSWITVLRKREHYRRAFFDFDPVRVAAMTDAEIEERLQDTGLIRNRLKLFAMRSNAQAFLQVQREFGSFDTYVWGFTGGKVLDGRRGSLRDLPATSQESDALSKDLKKRGFKFVGSTICYAHMQATGMVNDHVQECFRHQEV